MSSNTRAISIREQLLRECRAMAQYALASGVKLPGASIQTLVSIGQASPDDFNCQIGDGVAARGSDAQGMAADPDSVMLTGQTISQLVQIHGRLSDIVAPATPRTILLLSEEAARDGFWHFLGPVPLIRRMMLIAILSLIALISISLSKSVNGDTNSFSLFSNHGVPLLLNELFLLSAAGVGASFAALFQASRYVQDGTFDPMCESTYWIRFVLGLLAGMMLAALVPLETFAKVAPANPSAFPVIGKPLLALLGGFSAVLVYRILNRLIDAVDSLVRGNEKDLLVAQQQTAKARAAEFAAEQRMQIAARLAILQRDLRNNAEPQNLERELDSLHRYLISPDSANDIAAVILADPSVADVLPDPSIPGGAAPGRRAAFRR